MTLPLTPLQRPDRLEREFRIDNPVRSFRHRRQTGTYLEYQPPTLRTQMFPHCITSKKIVVEMILQQYIRIIGEEILESITALQAHDFTGKILERMTPILAKRKISAVKRHPTP